MSVDPIRMAPTATRLGRGAWAQIKRRAAIRRALLEGAYRLALGLADKTPPHLADKFKNHVRAYIRRVGDRPMGVAPRLMAVIRGGPATLFDGPEGHLWEARVKRLGAAAFEALFGESVDEELRSWAESIRLSSDDVGRRYLASVEDYLTERGSTSTSAPELAILGEQARIQAEQTDLLRRQPTKFRVTTVMVGAALGALGGNAINIDEPVQVPNWAETAVLASAAGGAAAAERRGRRDPSDDEEVIVAELAETITLLQYQLRRRLRRVVDPLLTIVDVHVRGPPHPEQSVIAAIETALDLLRQRTSDRSEVLLSMSGVHRDQLKQGAEALFMHAQDSGIAYLDEACMELIDSLAGLVETITIQRPPNFSDANRATWEQEIALGRHFLTLLVSAWNVAARLEDIAPSTQPSVPTTLRLHVENGRAA